MIDRVYQRIAESFDRDVMRAPKEGEKISPAFIEFLKLVYSEEEAELVQYLDPLPFFKTGAEISAESGRSEKNVAKILNALDNRSVLVANPSGYCLPGIPDVINFHQIYPEVRAHDLEAGRLYEHFFIKDEYYKYYEGSEEGTPVSRSLPVGEAIAAEDRVLTGEEAHERILNAISDYIALQPCPCRTRTEKLGTRECKGKFPIGYCIFFGEFARRSVEHGYGKKVTREEASNYLKEMQELGMITTSDNYKSGDPMVICSCCACCCSMLRGRTRWNNPKAVSPSNYIPIANEDCVLCGTCVDRCQMGALSLDDEAGRATVDPGKCLGCGVCTLACPQEALKLHRYERSVPFENAKELWETVARENKVTLRPEP